MSGDTPADRLVAALNDPDRLFTRDQVAYLMAAAARWAREDAAEVWPPGPWPGAVEHRHGMRAARWDAWARRGHRRPSDYRGGPVPVWAADLPDPRKG